MPHTQLLLILFSLITTSSSKLDNSFVSKSLLGSAELGTMWKNNPFLLHNKSPDDNFSVRLILGTNRISVDYIDSPPLFSCGFLFSMDPVYGLPNVVWSANRDSPVRENATVQFTELGDLMLHVGQKLMASTSETNWTNGRFYVTVLSDGMYAFAGVDTPLPYYRIHILDVFTSFRGTEPDYQIQLPKDNYGLEFVRIDWDGHLRLYQWGNSSWTSSDVLDITDPCSYPLSCGEYGICSDGQCSCPDAALRQSGLFDYDSLSCGSAHKASFLALPNTTTFNSVFNWTTSEEQCKISCLNDCSCMIAFFHRTNASSGFCYLAYEIFSMISVNRQSYSRNFSSYAFVKVQEHRTMLSKGKIAIIFVVSLVFVASVLITLLMVLRRKSTELIEDGDTIDQLPGLPTRFSFESLKLATGDFSRKIGEGGSGSVFEGHVSDKQVAVKRLDGINQGEMEFLMEVQTVGSINHIHLWIFAKHQAAPLDWETRLKIIIDVAGGLAYLHSDCRQIIAHLDIKPQNILLDDMFSAKVSDFGLAKLIDREQSTVMTRLRGTPENRHLVSLVQDKAKDDRMLDLIDPRSTDMELHLEEVLRVMNLALWCLQVDASRRPSMSLVVKVLEGTMSVETDLDLDLVNIDLMMANRAAHRNAVTLQIESILSGPR
ncbi:hypothetical protein HU200_062949 [Digitaria exilis]|uniref:non-specific serine/threonine protein kinase n=1 Tax=Digitaria exilis TaxID=1010633 RepID=A0A835ABZ6_9POAL|nr:hypothetical protein HU200_062949 [Digitaria exilis]